MEHSHRKKQSAARCQLLMGFILYILYIDNVFFNQHLSCITAHYRHHFSILSSVLPDVHSSSCLEVSVHLSGVVWSKLDLQDLSLSLCALLGRDGTEMDTTWAWLLCWQSHVGVSESESSREE